MRKDFRVEVEKIGGSGASCLTLVIAGEMVDIREAKNYKEADEIFREWVAVHKLPAFSARSDLQAQYVAQFICLSPAKKSAVG